MLDGEPSILRKWNAQSLRSGKHWAHLSAPVARHARSVSNTSGRKTIPACCSSEHGRFAVLNRGLRLAKFGVLHIYIQKYISFEIISKSYRLGEGDGGTESWDFGRDGRNPVQAKNAQPKSTWDFWAHGILATVALGELLWMCSVMWSFFGALGSTSKRWQVLVVQIVWGGA